MIRQVLSGIMATRRSKTTEEDGFPKKKVKATTTESHLSSCFDFSSLGDGVVRVVKEGGRCLVVVLEGWS